MEEPRRLGDRLVFRQRVTGDEQRLRRHAKGERRAGDAPGDGLAEAGERRHGRGVLRRIERPVARGRREGTGQRNRLPRQLRGQGRLGHGPCTIIK